MLGYSIITLGDFMKKYTGIIIIVVVLVLLLILFLAVSKGGKTTEKGGNYLSGKHHIVIDIKDYGKIEAELDADQAPITVTNFITLAESGFYDGLTFHRIISGFMMQGGDPNGDGTGGAKNTIKGEFKNNGVDNNISHTRGTLSMARSKQYDSASSQFFIVHEDSLHLDDDYAGFGHVTSGMDVVDKICENAKPVDAKSGLIPANEQPVITSITVID